MDTVGRDLGSFVAEVTFILSPLPFALVGGVWLLTLVVIPAVYFLWKRRIPSCK